MKKKSVFRVFSKKTGASIGHKIFVLRASRLRSRLQDKRYRALCLVRSVDLVETRVLESRGYPKACPGVVELGGERAGVASEEELPIEDLRPVAI